MATHSRILAWRIPGTEEPGHLQSMGSQRVRHDWSELAFVHEGKNQKSNKTKNNKTSDLCTQKAQSPVKKKPTSHPSFAVSAFEDCFTTRKVHTIHYWESECMMNRIASALSNRSTTERDLNKAATCYLTKQEVQRCHSGAGEFGGPSRREVSFLPPLCHWQGWHCLPWWSKDAESARVSAEGASLLCFHFPSPHASPAVSSHLKASLAQQQETWEWLQPASLKHVALKKLNTTRFQNQWKWGEMAVFGQPVVSTTTHLHHPDQQADSMNQNVIRCMAGRLLLWQLFIFFFLTFLFLNFQKQAYTFFYNQK